MIAGWLNRVRAAWERGKRPGPSHPALALEPLESRLLLTTLVTVELRAVATPTVAEVTTTLPSPAPEAMVGEGFFLEIWLQDLGPDNPQGERGIAGGQLDVAYDTMRLDATDVTLAAAFESPSFTIHDDTGLIDDISGFNFTPDLGADPQWAKFATIDFTATALGTADFAAQPGTAQIARWGAGNVDWADVDLGTTDIACIGASTYDVVIGDGGAKSLMFTDPDGTPVQIRVKASTATVRLAGTNMLQEPGKKGITVTGEDIEVVEIALANTTAKSSLTIKTKKGGDNKTAVHDITADGPLKAIAAKTTNLLGDIALAGALGKGQLANVADAHTITIGGSTDDKPLTLVFDQVQDLVLDSDTPIKALTVTEWTDTDATPDTLAAPSLAKLTTKGRKANAKKGIAGLAGNFEASLDLDATLGKAKIAGSVTQGTWTIAGAVGSITTGLDFCADLDALSLKSMSVKGNLDGATIDLTQAVDPKLTALGKLAVTGWTRNTIITAAGNVAKFQTGGMDGSCLLLGCAGMELPDEAADFADEALLKSFTVKGIKDGKLYLDSFIDSDVAAWCITKANVREVVTDNASEPFGFAWCELKSLTWQDGRDKFRWPEKKPTDWPEDTGDLELRVLA